MCEQPSLGKDPMADDDKVFLITGASTGIGAATARLAVQAGYRVVLSARSEDKLEALASELGGDDHALAVPADVGVWADNERLAQTALDRYGRIDVVFANAGFGAQRSFLGDSPEHWREMVLTNVLGVAYTIPPTPSTLVSPTSRQCSGEPPRQDRKSTRLNSSHPSISYAVF